MNLKNFKPQLKKTIKILSGRMGPSIVLSKKYIKLLMGYFQTSEAIFLLFFAGIVGVGAGFGAIIFRWMIAFFQNLFFTQGQHALAFLGSSPAFVTPPYELLSSYDIIFYFVLGLLAAIIG